MAVLAVLGVSLGDLPAWLRYAIILAAVLATVVMQVLAHGTARARSADQAAAAVKQAQADTAKHNAALAAIDLARNGVSVPAAAVESVSTTAAGQTALNVSRETPGAVPQ